MSPVARRAVDALERGRPDAGDAPRWQVETDG
jgi:hypothetical protein